MDPHHLWAAAVCTVNKESLKSIATKITSWKKGTPPICSQSLHLTVSCHRPFFHQQSILGFYITMRLGYLKGDGRREAVFVPSTEEHPHVTLFTLKKILIPSH